MLLCDGIGGGMNRFAALKAYCNQGDEDAGSDTSSGANLNFAFYSGLCRFQKISYDGFSFIV